LVTQEKPAFVKFIEITTSIKNKLIRWSIFTLYYATVQ